MTGGMAFLSPTWFRTAPRNVGFKTHSTVAYPRKIKSTFYHGTRASLSTAKNNAPSPKPATSTQSAAPAIPYNWLEQWFPVTYEQDVKDNDMYPFRIFDKAYILVRDVNGTYTVMDDLCPHRAAPLSEGRVFNRTAPDGKQQTVIECGYHGWRFGCDGGCLDIPAKTSEPSKYARVRGVYKTAVSPFKLIFVWLGEPDKATALPLPKDLLSPDPKRPVLYLRHSHRTLPLPFDIVMENLLDPAHVQWSHHKADGDRRSFPTAERCFQVTEQDPAHAHFGGVYSIGSFELVGDMRGIQVQYSFLKNERGEPRLFFYLWVVPVSRDITKLFAHRMFFDPPLPLRILSIFTPRWKQHASGNLVLDGDTPLLHSQNRHLVHTAVVSGKPGWRSQYLLSETKYDSMVVEFRRWFDAIKDQLPFISPPLTQIPDPLSRSDINDRYRWHVQDCKACSDALRNFRILRNLTCTIAFLAVLGSLTTAMCGAALATGQPAASQSLARYAKALLISGIFMVATALMANRAVKSFTYTTKARRLLMTPDTTF